MPGTELLEIANKKWKDKTDTMKKNWLDRMSDVETRTDHYAAGISKITGYTKEEVKRSKPYNSYASFASKVKADGTASPYYKKYELQIEDAKSNDRWKERYIAAFKPVSR